MRPAHAATAAPELLETRTLLAAAALPPQVTVCPRAARLELDAGDLDPGSTAEWRVFNLDGRFVDRDAPFDPGTPREIARTGATASVDHAETDRPVRRVRRGRIHGRRDYVPGFTSTPLRVELTVTDAAGAVTDGRGGGLDAGRDAPDARRPPSANRAVE